MRVGIIGAGNVGTVLAKHLTALGHQLVIANSRGPSSLGEVAAKTGAAAGTLAEAVHGRDKIIVTITMKGVTQLPPDLFDGVPPGVVVADTCNYYPERDGHVAELDAGLPESRWVERHLRRPVVKAFNAIVFTSMADRPRPKGAADRIALPVAGDDPVAKAAVMDLVEAVGFDALDAGGLDESWRQQPGTPVYCRDYDVAGVRRALAEARPEQMPEYRRVAAEQAKAYMDSLAAKG